MLRRQRLNGRRAQAGDPIQARRFEIIADARRGDHAPVPDQDQAADAETMLELLDLSGQRRRLSRVAVQDFHRDRKPRARAQQSINGLWPLAPVIASMTMM